MSVNDTVKEWLDNQWESSGPKTDWSEVQWDKYHAQLGLLICFVDDCVTAKSLCLPAKEA